MWFSHRWASYTWVLVDRCSTDQILSHFLKGMCQTAYWDHKLDIEEFSKAGIFLNSEIRSLKMPPDEIRDVLEAVLRLMCNYDTTWLNMKKFLGHAQLRKKIMNFNAQRITKDPVQDLQKLMPGNQTPFSTTLSTTSVLLPHLLQVRFFNPTVPQPCKTT